MKRKATVEFSARFLVKILLIIIAIIFVITMFKQLMEKISVQGIFVGLIIIVALIAFMDNIIELFKKLM